MAIKSPGKEQSAPVRVDAPAPEDLRIAYQVHTLAQMLYGHLSTAHPWYSATPTTYGYEPLGGPHVPPVAQAWPGTWGYPYGWIR